MDLLTPSHNKITSNTSIMARKETCLLIGFVYNIIPLSPLVSF